jgi:hypothetical protein
MKKLTTLLITATLTCGMGALSAQQQNPDQSHSPQNSQDVPEHTPGSNNPDLQNQRKPTPVQKDSGTGTSSPQNPDQGTQNPDEGTGWKKPDQQISGTSRGASKKKNRKKTSSTSQNDTTTSQNDTTTSQSK